jgi:hypothetical protein
MYYLPFQAKVLYNAAKIDHRGVSVVPVFFNRFFKEMKSLISQVYISDDALRVSFDNKIKMSEKAKLKLADDIRRYLPEQLRQFISIPKPIQGLSAAAANSIIVTGDANVRAIILRVLTNHFNFDEHYLEESNLDEGLIRRIKEYRFMETYDIQYKSNEKSEFKKSDKDTFRPHDWLPKETKEQATVVRRLMNKIGLVFDDIIRKNKSQTRDEKSLFTCKYLKSDSAQTILQDIIDGLVDGFGLEPNTFISMAVLIGRYFKVNTQDCLNEQNVRNLITACLTLSLKIHEDMPLSNEDLGLLTNVELKEVNAFEIEIFRILNFNIIIEPDEADKLVKEIKNYEIGADYKDLNGMLPYSKASAAVVGTIPSTSIVQAQVMSTLPLDIPVVRVFSK